MQLCITGRQPEFALAELESVYGSVEQVGSDAVLVQSENPINLSQLGSVLKVAVGAKEVSSDDVSRSITEMVLAHASARDSDSKLTVGVSWYGQGPATNIYQKKLFTLKKNLTKQGLKIRIIIPKSGTVLNAAEITHNKLLRGGIELIVVSNSAKTYLAITSDVQDIDSYSKRDYGRPCRDAKVGMFPPKLAQIMINLAGVDTATTIVDPFCGSGVVLQEALLMGYSQTIGSDLESRMSECSKANLEWLRANYDFSGDFELTTADARQFTPPSGKYSVVTEGYLGQPLSVMPSAEKVAELQAELQPLYEAFLAKLLTCDNSPQSVIITIPVWQTKDKKVSLLSIDQIDHLGYTCKQFQSVDSHKLIYIRENQIVGRQILVLTKG